MIADDALEALAEKARPLMMERQPGEPKTAPINMLVAEYTEFERHVRKLDSVPPQLALKHELLLALTIDTKVEWTEPGEGEVRDPLTGRMMPKRVRRSVKPPHCAGCHDVKYVFVDFVRTTTAFAKRIDSPTYPIFRECLIRLYEWFAHHNMLHPVDDELAREVVEKLDVALFELNVDKEVYNVYAK